MFAEGGASERFQGFSSSEGASESSLIGGFELFTVLYVHRLLWASLNPSFSVCMDTTILYQEWEKGGKHTRHDGGGFIWSNVSPVGRGGSQDSPGFQVKPN